MKDVQQLYGRWFTKYQLSKEERQQAEVLEADTKKCRRCATPFSSQHRLPNGAYYCRECLLLGRVRSDEPLYYFPQQAFPPQHSLSWQGQLTDWQLEISEGLRENVSKRIPTLVHAVTGAGKTEMMYQTVADVLDSGGSVCLASPRVDVCIELYKRMKNDFSCPIALLHGESEPYFRTPLVIATTHQLLKFYHAFDLLLIDEVDAFPYVDNAMLYHAVDQARKQDGVQVFLTATSTDELDQKVRQKKLERLRLPRRFHGNPLVVPKTIWLPSFTKMLQKQRLAPHLKKRIAEQRQTGYPLLLFVPEIKAGQQLATLLQQAFPAETIGFVSSQTEERLAIVEGFRQKEIGILISTTILERGVTFPCVDVFVLQANHKLYTSSSLVQIAGRVGRSMERPTGDLLYFIEENTHAIQKAILEIRQMNKEAGYG